MEGCEPSIKLLGNCFHSRVVLTSSDCNVRHKKLQQAGWLSMKFGAILNRDQNTQLEYLHLMRIKTVFN